ncbi:MAG: hypothetical protein V8Q30_11980 [Acutalibacteraceae bacterium]
MFSKKKTECRVCGYRFTPERENIYTAEEPRSMADMLTKAPTRFSAVDCPVCGCQIALAIRVPRVDISDNAERNDADAYPVAVGRGRWRVLADRLSSGGAKMKIKSIAAICKKNKNIAIFERYSDDGDILTQYIGDGSAVYPVVGLPQLDKESLLTIFDVPEKDRDNYFVKALGVPAGISFEDTDETERHVEREGISIIYSGRTLKPIRTTRGLVFIESRYLSPVADVLDVLELYERRTAEGTPYIVAKAGFLLQAVIMPYDVINQQFVESLQDLTRECEFSLSEKERREREARDRFTFTEPEQCSLNVDPDTGEVVEESEVADNA